MQAPGRLGRYEVLQLVGQGAMGHVYRARDPVLDRTVALKTLGRGLLAAAGAREEFLERFQREARAAARLSHPSIVSVHDLGFDEASGTPYIVMEYVAGASLARVLADGPILPVDQAAEMVEQIATALDEAHRHGVVHRDIKPANVFLDLQGRIKVGDFGIARLEGSELTRAGAHLGTPGYIAPEVLRGAPADARSDLFALGVVAYQLLTGRRAFTGETRADIAVAVCSLDPPAPERLRPEIGPALSGAVMRALAKTREGRTRSAAAFLDELRGGRPGSPPTSPEIAPDSPRRVVVLGILIGLFLLAGTGMLLALYWLGTQE
jgi:eukaryotic-like serine/threonine-protein kinase